MAKNISLLGADYPDVPAVTLPQTGGGTATFYDVEVTDGDPTLAWGTRSTVGTVNGIDLHVTMPAKPTIQQIIVETKTITTDQNGVYTFSNTYNSSTYEILSAVIVRDGTYYNSWAGFIVGQDTNGWLSLKAVDNGVNPIKSIVNTGFKVRLVLLKKS